MPERWVSVDEGVGHLGVAKDTVYLWIEPKGLPGRRVGWLWEFKLSRIDEWAQRGGAANHDGATTPTKGEHS